MALLRKYPSKRKVGVVPQIQRVVERQRKDDISQVGAGTITGDFAGIDQQMASDQSPGSPPVDFELNTSDRGGVTYSGGNFYVTQEGWWQAWCYLNFSSDANHGAAGRIVSQLRFADDNDQYLAVTQHAGLSLFSAGVDFGGCVCSTPPLKIDSSYSNPYFYALGDVYDAETGSVIGGSFFGFAGASAIASRMGVFKVG